MKVIVLGTKWQIDLMKGNLGLSLAICSLVAAPCSLFLGSYPYFPFTLSNSISNINNEPPGMPL